MTATQVGKNERRVYFLLIFCVLAVCLAGWQIPLMEIDAVQYANISREMLINKSFLQVFDLGHDYLDKPPMLFWLSAASMKIFGVNDVAYRLPSFLFAVLSIYSTYRMALLFYNERIAWMSALVLASSQAMFLITHDVRTDTMLMGWVIFGIWQFSAWYRSGKWRYLIAGSIAIAGGLLTKGPIALVVPIFSFAPHFLFQRAYRQFFRWEYMVAIAIISVLLIPMCIGLYCQFDLHPEKVMYGRQGVSGLRFYFWTQSFGRITGESTWHENDYFFFLFENMLWGLLPWIIFFVFGLVDNCAELIKNRCVIALDQEWITTGGFIVTYCALAMSRAQLPHYIYIVFPFTAIITGKWLFKLLYTDSCKRMVRPLTAIHAILFCLLLVVVFLLLYYPFPSSNVSLIVVAVLILLLLSIALKKKWIPLPNLLVLSIFTILFINLFLDTGFYPHLLQYQMSTGLSRYIKQHSLDKDHIFIYKTTEHRSIDFYNNHSFRQIIHPDTLAPGDFLLASAEAYGLMNKNKYRIVYAGESFHVSQLSAAFLNPATRKNETSSFFLLQKI